jgi:hypothetical protein
LAVDSYYKKRFYRNCDLSTVTTCSSINPTYGAVMGRPYFEMGVNGTKRALVSPLVSEGGASSSWALPQHEQVSVAKFVGGEEAEADRMAHVEWAKRGQSEHASVASFARFSLQLMGLGAPASLLEASAQAQLDEIRHAKLAFSAAATFGSTHVDLRPGAFPAHTVQVGLLSDMPAIASAIVIEGCIGETLAAFRASVELQTATHPAALTALAEVAVDEARHAGLAWRALAWIVQEGGSDVREAALDAFREAIRAEPNVVLQDESHTLLEARGIIKGTHLANLRRVAWERAVQPMAVKVLGKGAEDFGWSGVRGERSVDGKASLVFEEARRLIAQEARLESVTSGNCAEAITA